MAEIPKIDYTNKDFASLRQAMLDDAARRLPEWTSRSVNDFGVVLIEAFAYVGDVLSYYIDRVAAESFLATAVQRSSVLSIAAMLDYRPDNGRPSIVPLTIGVAPGSGTVTIPAGTQFSSPSGQPEVCPVVIFETDSDLIITQDPSIIVYGTVNATQGETVADEEIGQSDGQENQSFPLANGNVIEGATYVYVDEGTGPQPWTFTEHLIDAGPGDTVFTTVTSADDITSVVFGDGTSGRVPFSGALITTTYRIGGGTVGNVGALTVDTILGAPSQVVSVSNQQAAAGGTDAESTDQIRANAPKALSTLHRAVSLADYANLCYYVAGVGKANADGLTYTNIVVYVAPIGGGIPMSSLKERVLAYLADKKMVNAHVVIEDPVYVPINMSVDIQIAPQYSQAAVINAARNALTDLLSFDNVSFAQRVTLSDMYRALSQVPGVVYANITILARSTDVVQGATDVVLEANEIPTASGGAVIVTATGGGISSTTGGSAGGGEAPIPGAPGSPSIDSLSCGTGHDFTMTLHWGASADTVAYTVILDFFNGTTYVGSINGGTFATNSAALTGSFAGADTVQVHVQSVNGSNRTDGPATTTSYPCG